MIIDFQNIQRRYRIVALLSIWKWLMAIFIAVIWACKEVCTPRIDPIDNQMTRNRELVRQIFVVDEKRNGFRVCYITKKDVTKDRLDEIRGRTSVRDSLNNLKMLAPLKFGNMLLTDIYDFADFAVRFDPADIRIDNIFVCGHDKENLYIGENPRITDWAKWIHPSTLQGLLYITSEDIYFNSENNTKVYRYYKCRGIHQIAETDEHFSHFSESERLY